MGALTGGWRSGRGGGGSGRGSLPLPHLKVICPVHSLTHLKQKYFHVLHVKANSTGLEMTRWTFLCLQWKLFSKEHSGLSLVSPSPPPTHAGMQARYCPTLLPQLTLVCRPGIAPPSSPNSRWYAGQVLPHPPPPTHAGMQARYCPTLLPQLTLVCRPGIAPPPSPNSRWYAGQVLPHPPPPTHAGMQARYCTTLRSESR